MLEERCALLGDCKCCIARTRKQHHVIILTTIPPQEKPPSCFHMNLNTPSCFSLREYPIEGKLYRYQSHYSIFFIMNFQTLALDGMEYVYLSKRGKVQMQSQFLHFSTFCIKKHFVLNNPFKVHLYVQYKVYYECLIICE